MSIRNDSKLLAEAYGSIDNVSLTPSSMLGGKPVMITMDMPGAAPDHIEGDNGADQSEIEMASAELHKVVEYAPKLAEMIKSMSNLEGWVSSKITKAADYISSVYHWLEFQQHEGGNGNCECSENEHDEMYNTGHEDVGACSYAQQGCKCHGCPDCY